MSRRSRYRTADLDPRDEMALFDKLPPKIRHALNVSPSHYVFLDQWIWAFIKQRGVDEAARLIREGKFGREIDGSGN